MARRDGCVGINPAELASIRHEGRRYLLLGAAAGAVLAATAPLSWCGYSTAAYTTSALVATVAMRRIARQAMHTRRT